MPDPATKAATYPAAAAAASPAPLHTTPLSYAPIRRHRRCPRWIGWALLFVVVAIGVWQGRPLYRQVQYLAWQRRCMTYTRPPDMVVYEEDPQRAGVLQ